MKRISVPTISTEQMQMVERLLAEQYSIDPLQWMENAGRSLAMLARRLLDHEIENRAVVLLAGQGTSGGCGLAAARHLLNWDADVQVLCVDAPDAYEGAAAHQLHGLQAMGAPLAWAEEGWELPPCDLVIDAVVGYGLRDQPRGRDRDLIQLANSSVAPILSLDVPSGLNSETGTVYSPCIRATATLALGLPKPGVAAPDAETVCGELYLADIGVPQVLYAEMNIDVPNLFGLAPIVRLIIDDGELMLEPEPAHNSRL